MSVFRNRTATLSIKGSDDSLLKGPLGYDFATVAYLCAMREQKLIDTMKADDYKAFVEGNEVTALVTKKEDVNILRVMVQLGNGTCICGDELTDSDFRKKETVLAVGCIKWGKTYNFVFDNAFDLQPVVHKYLLQLWEAVYGLNKSDPDFVDKLLALHYQLNPDEEKPQTQQPAQPQQPVASGSAGVQTGSNGTTTIGDFYSYNALKLKATLVQNKDNTLITDANDAIMRAMSGNLTQAAGIYLGVYGQENSDAARQRKVAELVGFKEEQIDTLFGKKPKDGSGDKDGKDGKKDADGKAEEDELTKTEKYEYEVGFGDEPELTDGTPVKLTRVQGALEAVKTTALAEGNSLGRMYKLVRAWNALECIIKEASDAGYDTVGMTCLHYRLSEVDAFMLKIQGKKGLMPLCFGNEKKPQQSNN